MGYTIFDMMIQKLDLGMANTCTAALTERTGYIL